MRKRFALGLLLILVPTLVQGQVDGEITVPTPLTSSALPSVGPVAPAIGSTAHGHHGSKKGALIGMAIGVGLGLMLGGACESGDCASRALGVAAVLGAMGAGIGAMFSSHQGPVTVDNAPRQRGRRAVVRGTQSWRSWMRLRCLARDAPGAQLDRRVNVA